MKRNLILVSSTILLLSVPAFAADKSKSEVLNPSQTAKEESTEGVWSAGARTAASKTTTTAAAHRSGKLQIPPAPVVPVVTVSESKTKASSSGSRADTSLVTVGQGGPYTAKSVAAQRFADYLELKQDQASSPLTLTVNNNGFSWFRLLIANQVIATEKSMKGKDSATFDLTGLIDPGSNQIVITGAGSPGSTLGWKVTTVSTAKLDRVDPDEALVGETVRVKGKGFSSNKSADVVSLEGKSLQVVAASPTELQVVIPKDAPTGDVKMSAKVNGVKTNSVKIKVRGIPEVSGSNIQGVPPGQQVTIYGKNFSKTLSENQVMFGGTSAQVVSGNDTQLTVIAPNLPWTAGHVPSAVTVKVGKAISKNSINVQIGPQMFADPSMNPGGPQGSAPIYAPGDNQ